MFAALAAAPCLPARALDTLVVRDGYPAGTAVWVPELESRGFTPTEITSDALATTDLTAYDLVITVSYQGAEYNEALTAAAVALMDFVDGGGVLVWSGSRTEAQSPYPAPPFGGANDVDPATTNANVAPHHPIMAGMPPNLHAIYASDSCVEAPAAGAEVLAVHGSNGKATFYLLRQGSGLMVASTVNWEEGWRDDTEMGLLLTNTLDWLEDFAPCQDRDADGDGWSDCGDATAPPDCDDSDPGIHPGAVESCNDGVDSNCDGQTAEEADDDGDGFSNCDGDCDDGDPSAFPGGVEACDGADNDCDGWVDEDFDADLDGWTTCAGLSEAWDCDDSDPTVFPGVPEDCNGVDDDCDGTVDEIADQDGDGWSVCAGDCDDLNPYTWPGAPERCDSADNSCDGSVGNDEDDTDGDWYRQCEDCDDGEPTTYPGADEDCLDEVDSDCLGDLAETETDNDGDGYAECAGDCDDVDDYVYPGRAEVCNGKDDDCDPDTDELADSDADGFSICDGDCDDAEPLTFPDNPEVCDGVDNDCNGQGDEELDEDRDGYDICDDADCNDHNAAVYPGAPEVPYDFVDQDCDGLDLDDVDHDGYEGGPWGQDCNDQDPAIYPGAEEICDNGIDNDCDQKSDEFDEDCAADEPVEEAGCACRATAGAPYPAGGVVLLVLAALRRRVGNR